MYDTKKIMTGLVIFLVLITFPIWYNRGKAAPVADPVLPKTGGVCIESTDYMASSHMQLLDKWRDSVVRKASRVYTNEQGKSYNMSLTNTCLECHTSKADFCDRCHLYTGVTPYCWVCHFDNREGRL